MKVVCINVLPLEGNDIAPLLTNNEVYEVKQQFLCSCGQHHFDVGLISQHNFIRCYKCEQKLPDGDKIHWCHPNRFKDYEG